MWCAEYAWLVIFGSCQPLHVERVAKCVAVPSRNADPGGWLQGSQSSCCEGGLDSVVAEGVTFTFYPVSRPQAGSARWCALPVFVWKACVDHGLAPHSL